MSSEAAQTPSSGSAASIEIVALSPERVDDFLMFFDHERGPAFSDNPEWAKCYCQFYHTPMDVDWNGRPGGPNREAMRQRIATGEMEGFLAYAASDGRNEVVGWLNAQPRSKLPHCFARMRLAPTSIDLPLHRVAQVLCFVIHPQWRRRGIAKRLLEHACGAFERRGIALVEAYPFKSGDSVDAGDHYHGSLPMFIAAGFEIAADAPTMTIVRRTLAGNPS